MEWQKNKPNMLLKLPFIQNIKAKTQKSSLVSSSLLYPIFIHNNFGQPILLIRHKYFSKLFSSWNSHCQSFTSICITTNPITETASKPIWFSSPQLKLSPIFYIVNKDIYFLKFSLCYFRVLKAINKKLRHYYRMVEPKKNDNSMQYRILNKILKQKKKKGY